ncbi:MAG: hypothetical protein KA163_06955 [Bacteroidia bacterium]|nr:hypothetical protein [Bacteroidia bacterium]
MKKTIKFILLIAIIIGGISCNNKANLAPQDGPKLKIGDVYYGGAVFYVEPSGKHGLVVNFDGGSTVVWAPYSAITGATQDTLYAGLNNTNLLASFFGSATCAARKCYDKVSYDYNDWYLPSKYELNLLRLQNKSLPTYYQLNEGSYYWSSTEFSSTQAWRQLISATTLNQSKASKTGSNYYVAIRRF